VAYLKEAAEKVLLEMKKAQAGQKREVVESCAVQNIEAKTVLQKKAEEAKLQRESDWGSSARTSLASQGHHWHLDSRCSQSLHTI
jgi:hypothetical protein